MIEDRPPDLDGSPVWWGIAVPRTLGHPQGNLEREGLRLRRAIESRDDSHLGMTIEGIGYSLHHTKHSVVQHDRYSARQIALLKEALRAAFSRAAGAGA